MEDIIREEGGYMLGYFDKGKEVSEHALRGEWKQVVEIYKIYGMMNVISPITTSGDTVLHIAARRGKDDVVAQILNHIIMMDDEQSMNISVKKVLETKNWRRQDTPLHVAASVGNVNMCRFIASVDPTLVDCRNAAGETPLFLAAFHGHKQLFLFLHFLTNFTYYSLYSLNYNNCTRNDGDTILHRAILAHNLDLAFEIIHLYSELANSVNECGLSPLHILAAKPSAFKSGSHLGLIETIIYQCISAKKLKVEEGPKLFQPEGKAPTIIHQNYPQNYKTCFKIFSVIKFAVDYALGRKKPQARGEDPEKAEPETSTTEGSEGNAQRPDFLPANQITLHGFVKLLHVILLFILGLGPGSNYIKKIRGKKEKHIWSVQIMNELLAHTAQYQYLDYGRRPGIPRYDESAGEKEFRMKKVDTPILIATKKGVTEMVEKIIQVSPEAILDMDNDEKNLVLLAVENRQLHVYRLLLKIMDEDLFREVDNEGNSALHLAAKYSGYNIWLTPVLQMQWEIKWFEFVRDSMPPHFFVQHNKSTQTAIQLFDTTHKDLVRIGGDWLNKISKSCSVVAGLITTVAFATTTAVPTQGKAKTSPEEDRVLNVYAVSSLISVFGSVTSVIMFLSLLTSSHERQDFRKKLPLMLVLALTSMFISILSMLISFCTAHFFIVQDDFRNSAIPLYFVASLPLILFFITYLPLYFLYLLAIFTKVPFTTPLTTLPHY